MRNQTKIVSNMTGLEELTKAMSGSGYVTRVGILGEKAARKSGEMNNPTLGLIMEVGSATNNIPARSWLMMPITVKYDTILQRMSGAAVKEALEKKYYKRIFGLLGTACEFVIQQAFATSGFGTWAENSAYTIKMKGSSKPLIDTSQLRRSVTSDVVRRSELK